MGQNSKFQILSYLLSGKLLHIISIIEVIAGFFLISWIYSQDTTHWLTTGIKIYSMVFIASLPVFSQLDARSRFQNYKQLKDQFIMYGFDKRILNPIIKSRCQRDAALLAAREAGFMVQCRDAFRKAGYRWYHLLPDFVFSKPQFLLTKYFWKTTFFCPTYQSKLNQDDSHLLLINATTNYSMIHDG